MLCFSYRFCVCCPLHFHCGHFLENHHNNFLQFVNLVPQPEMLASSMVARTTESCHTCARCQGGDDVVYRPPGPHEGRGLGGGGVEGQGEGACGSGEEEEEEGECERSHDQHGSVNSKRVGSSFIHCGESRPPSSAFSASSSNLTSFLISC